MKRGVSSLLLPILMFGMASGRALSAGVAGEVVISLKPALSDFSEVESQSHQLVAPKSLALRPTHLDPDTAITLGHPEGLRSATFTIAGTAVTVLVWPEGDAIRYAVVRIGDTARYLENPETTPGGYVRWTLPADEAGGIEAPLCFQAGPGSNPLWLRYYLPSWREGVWEQQDGKATRIGLVDTDQDGDFSDPDGARLLMDLDGDGEFKLPDPTIENLELGEAYTAGGLSFRAKAESNGSAIRLVPSEESGLEIHPLVFGEPAPIFTAQEFDGTKRTLRDYRGKFVFIDIWATWCGPCIAEMPNIQKASETFKDENVVFISVSTDDAMETARAFIKEKGYTYPQLWCEGGWQANIMKLFQVRGIPSTFLIDPEGILLASNLRGETIEKTVSWIAKYDTPEGKAYFQQKALESALFKKIDRLQSENRTKEAMEAIDAFLEDHPDAEINENLKRWRANLEMK